ncbi:probable cytochrome P450 313a4 [Topomyia yanbarensis]|uniref:probable cytochrome P450 313a4 n=1 Tax=Topomyia yanbarensis TaxID=2498891 RepID=UPI00273BE9AD|nr:probable cytochrome P450 313a4 [Topomyia yanbarensis]
MFELLFIFITTSTLFYYYLSYRRSRKRLYELAAQIPGPFDWPLIGSAYLGITVGPTKMCDFLVQMLHTLSSPLRAWIGPLLFVFFDKPEHLEVILNSQSCVSKSYVHRFFRFEYGLLHCAPELWRVLRKRLNPSFSSTTIKNFVPTFNVQADKLVQYFEAFVDREAIDLLPKVSSYTLSAALLNLFGVNVRVNDTEYIEQFAENAEKMWLLMFDRIYKPWYYPDFAYKLTPSYRKEKKRIHKLQQLSIEVCTARESMRLKPKQYQSDKTVPMPEILIERLERITFETNEINEDIMLQNVHTFLFASNDTTSNVIATTLLMMAMYPDVQDRVHKEVTHSVSNDVITIDDLPSLQYLEMVIKESLRLVPVASIIGRICERELQVDNWTIPVGTEVFIPILKLHRDKSIWGQHSERFDPDNFLPERCAKRHPYAYLPFGGGIRNCIGMRYAWMSMKIALAKLIRMYEFSTELRLEDIKLIPSLVLLVANRHMMRIKRRKLR